MRTLRLMLALWIVSAVATGKLNLAMEAGAAAQVQVRIYVAGTITVTLTTARTVTDPDIGETTTMSKRCTGTFALQDKGAATLSAQFSYKWHRVRTSTEQTQDTLVTETGSYNGPGAVNEEATPPATQVETVVPGTESLSYWLDPVVELKTTRVFKDTVSDSSGPPRTISGTNSWNEVCHPHEMRPIIGTVKVGQPEEFATNSWPVHDVDRVAIGTVVVSYRLHLVVVVTGSASSAPSSITPTGTPTAKGGQGEGGTPATTATATVTPTSSAQTAGCASVIVPAARPASNAGTQRLQPGAALRAQPLLGAWRGTPPSAGVIWGTRPLTWSDFRATPPKAGPDAGFDATTSTIPGTRYRGNNCWQEDPATGMYRYTIQVTLLKGHARFLPASSWVKPGRQSPQLLDHEMRHFDITEVYARKASGMVAADFNAFANSPCGAGCTNAVCPGKALCATLTCPIAGKAVCKEEADAFWKKMRADYDNLVNLELATTQDQYDSATDHGRVPDQQQQWDAQIARWLSDSPY